MKIKILAVVLSVVILFGALPITVLAETKQKIAQTKNMGLSSADISLSGTNSVGAMLANELEEASGQNEGTGNVIYSVEIEEKEAFIELSTAVSCTLFVGVYTEDTAMLLSSGYTEVTPQDEYSFVTLDNAVPEYFYIKAFLIDKEDYSPLSTEYNNAMYTQEMQEFLSKTTDDFEEEKVINFDDDKTNNFAVLSAEVVVLNEESQTNKAVFADTASQIYIIENINETVSTLTVGDTFSFEYNGENFIVKIGEISVDGTTATILGADAELDEVFDYVRLDGSTGITEDTVDESACGEGITFEGYEDSATTYASRAIDIGTTVEKNAKFRLDHKLIGSDGAQVTLNGNIILKTVFSPKVYISLNYKYVEFKFDYNLSGGVSVTGKVEVVVPIAPLKFGVPGVSAEIIPKFVVSVSSKISLSGTLLKGSLGYGWYSDVGGVNLCSTPKMEAEIKAEIIIFLGIRVEPKVKVMEGTIAEASIRANLGFEGKFTPNGNISTSQDLNKKHDCTSCIDGDIYGKFDLTVRGNLLKNEKWKLNLTVTEIKIKICDTYWSLTHGEFAFTTCPHICYKLNVVVADTSGKAIEGAVVSVNNASYFTPKNGTISTFLPNGEYTITVSKEDFVSKEQTVYIKNNSKSLDTKLENRITIKAQTLSSGAGRTAIIDKNGELYLWGNNEWGQIGNGTTTNSLIPKKIMSNIASVSLGACHSAAITKTGELYMWGDNDWGELGDGTNTNSLTPKKLMNNVATVGLGWYHSAAITKNGELYMWGDNAYGQLGDGTTTNSLIPKKIMSNVVSVSLSEYHSAAITETGDLYMWGNNSEGQLGDGTTASSLIPKKVMSNVTSVSLGWLHSGAVTQNGDLYMWGKNLGGQLGDGTNTDSLIPKKIMSNVVSVSSLFLHSAAITKNGSLYIWGNGLLGDGTTNHSLIPKKIMNNVEMVSLGDGHSAAITKTGDLYMWGNNSEGQLGDGTTTDRLTPQKLTLPTTIMMSTMLYSVAPVADVLEESNFANLEPNSVYNFYIMKDNGAENAFSSDNLLYINQGKTDDTGAVTFDYINNSTDFDTAEKFVVKFKNALPDNTVSDMIITASADKIFLNVKDISLKNGGYENIRAKITVNGESTYISEYSENNGNLIFSYNISGEVTDDLVITAQLFADYAGVTYEVKEYHRVLTDARNDINADGLINAFDLVVLRECLLKIFDGNETFDPNGDGVISVKDLVCLKKSLAQ